MLSDGTSHDIKMAEALVAKHRPKALLGDKGYDSTALRTWLRNKRIRPVIPGRSCRAKKTRHDKKLYKQRNVVERWFGWIKSWSCLALRREKSDEMFLFAVHLVAIFHWLKNP